MWNLSSIMKRRRLAQAIVALLLATATACTIARPFSGPGLRAPGEVGAASMVTVVITHATLHGSRRGHFDRYTRRLVAALEAGTFAGLVGFSVRKTLFSNEVWTMSAWTDGEAVAGFARSSLHREAMAQAGDAIRSLRVRRVQVPPAAIPLSWKQALRYLDVPQTDRGAS